MGRMMASRKPSLWRLAGVGVAALASIFVLLLIAGGIAAHAQTHTASNTDSSSQPCTGLGTPQEDGNCQGTGQFGDQTGPDVESTGGAEVDG